MIEYDFTEISRFSVIDTCAILNIFSSEKFYNAIISADFSFCYTSFVEYETFFKTVKVLTKEIQNQRDKLRQETCKKRFRCEHLSIDDLQEIKILEARKRLGKGELSSIAFAKKTNQPFMTDDQGARKLGEKILGKQNVLTSPRILGWLYFHRILIDSDHKDVISEHKNSGRNMAGIYDDVYQEAVRRLYTCYF